MMTAADLPVIREEGNRVTFSSSKPAGFFFIIVGCIFFAPLFIGFGKGTLVWFFLFLGGMVAFFIGLNVLLRTNSITLDLGSRTYVRTKGFFWNPSVKSGSFDELEGVLIHSTPQIGTEVPTTMVGLLFREDHGRPLWFYAALAQRPAYEIWEKFTKLLQVRGIDKTNQVGW